LNSIWDLRSPVPSICQGCLGGQWNTILSIRAGTPCRAAGWDVCCSQVSIEDKRWNNGAFTKALIEGLGGKADFNREQAVRVHGLASYLANRVKELTEGRQMPVMNAPKTVVEDFPIATVQ
jgi:hypothetical protein